MTEFLLTFLASFGETFMKNIPISLALAAVFSVLTWFWACNPGRPWWHKRDLVTDLCYWFFIPGRGGTNAISSPICATGSSFPSSRAICASACWSSARRSCSGSRPPTA